VEPPTSLAKPQHILRQVPVAVAPRRRQLGSSRVHAEDSCTRLEPKNVNMCRSRHVQGKRTANEFQPHRAKALKASRDNVWSGTAIASSEVKGLKRRPCFSYYMYIDEVKNKESINVWCILPCNVFPCQIQKRRFETCSPHEYENNN
jgi:hypothetical protein